MYLVITQRTVTPSNHIFFEGVSWEKYEGGTDTDNKYVETAQGYDIMFDGTYYPIPKDNAVQTTRMTRLGNMSPSDYRYRKQEDDVKDYFKAVQDAHGIDMKINYAPQFADGVNPHKDKKHRDGESS